MQAERLSTRSARVAEGLALFETIYIPFPRQKELIADLEELRLLGLARAPGQPTRSLRVLQPSGAGKSTSAKQHKAHVEAQPGRVAGTRPVLHVTLSTTGTPRSLSASILDELGDSYSSVGTEELLLKRVRKAFEKEGVELLIIDELNHCAQKVLGRDVSNTLKNMLTQGWVPIAFMGTSDARQLFTANRELKNRSFAQTSLAPLTWDHDEDQELWCGFLAAMDQQLVAHGLMRCSSDLTDERVAEGLCTAANGLIGELHNILLEALRMVLRRDRERIEVTDLARAIDQWSLADGYIDHNPLHDL